MKLIWLLEENEKEWETENQEAREISLHLFFFFFFSFLRVFWEGGLGFFPGLF